MEHNNEWLTILDLLNIIKTLMAENNQLIETIRNVRSALKPKELEQ